MSNYGYFDYGQEERNRDDFSYSQSHDQHDQARSAVSGRGSASGGATFDYGHGQTDQGAREWSPLPRGRDSTRNVRRSDSLNQPAPRSSGLLETPTESRYQDLLPHDRNHFSPPSRSRSPLLGSRNTRDDQPYGEYEARDYDYYDKKQPEPEVRRRLHDRDRQERYEPVSAKPMASFQQPLLPEPDRQISFSSEYSRNSRPEHERRNSRPADFKRDKPVKIRSLLPDPEPLRRDPEPRSLEQDPYYRPGQRSFSSERRKNDDKSRTFQDRPRRSESRGRQDYSTRPALLPEPEVQIVAKQKSVQEVLGSFVQPGLQDTRYQMQMEQALYQSQEMLQQLETQSRVKGQKTADMEKELTRAAELKKLGVKPRADTSNRPLKPWEPRGALDPDRKRQIDEELRRLGVGTKDRNNTPQDVGFLPTPGTHPLSEPVDKGGILQVHPRTTFESYSSDSHQNEFSNPAFQDKSSRQTYPPPSSKNLGDGLLPIPDRNLGGILQKRSPETFVDSYPSDSHHNEYSNPAFQDKSTRQSYPPTSRKLGDGLLPIPDQKRFKGNDQSHRETGSQDRWQNKSQNKNQGNDRRNQGRNQDAKNDRNQNVKRNDGGNQGRTQSKERLNVARNQSSQQIDISNESDDDIIEIPVEPVKTKPVLSEDKEVQLVVDTIRSRFTTLEPSQLAGGKVLAGRTQLWKRNTDNNIVLSQFNALLKLGEYTSIQLYDRVIEGLRCYTCDEPFSSVKAYYDHERSNTHKSNWKKVQGDSAVNEVRMQLLQRLAVLPSIYSIGQNVSMKQDLLGRINYYFVCRVCHDVFRGPAEVHFKTATHINQEKKQVKCMDCKLYFVDFTARGKHYQGKVHQKVIKQGNQGQKGVVSKSPARTAPSSKSKTPPKSAASSANQDNKPPSKSTATMGNITSGTYTLTTSHYKERMETSDQKEKSMHSTQSSAGLSISYGILAVSGKSNSTPGKDSEDNSSKAKDDMDRRGSASGSTSRESTPRSSKGDSKLAKKGGHSSDKSGLSQGGKQEGKPKTKAEMVADLKRQIPKIVKANPNWTGEAKGVNYTTPVIGFFCKACGKFYNEKRSTREEHCSALQHQLNMKVFKLTQDKDKSLPKWMESLPGMASSQGSSGTEQTDDTDVVDMDVQTPCSSPDLTKEAGKEQTSEWFEGDLTL